MTQAITSLQSMHILIGEAQGYGDCLRFDSPKVCRILLCVCFKWASVILMYNKFTVEKSATFFLIWDRLLRNSWECFLPLTRIKVYFILFKGHFSYLKPINDTITSFLVGYNIILIQGYGIDFKSYAEDLNVSLPNDYCNFPQQSLCKTKSAH